MKPFIDNDFLLQNEEARRLYHDYAAHQPIIDFHNHLPPGEINSNKTYANLTEIWLKGDHYKWRAMRTAGIEEERITGKASDREKFHAWAETVPQTLKNPLYHWTHLELKRYFDIDQPLNSETAGEIWERTGEMLRQPEFSTRNLLKRKNVQVVCTTDDAVDSLEHHRDYMKQWRGGDADGSTGGDPSDNRKRTEQPNRTNPSAKRPDSGSFVMFPTFRPDNAMKIEDPPSFRNYVTKLEKASGIGINDYESFIQALRLRHDFFDTMGCRASDHGIEEPCAEDWTDSKLEAVFQKVRYGETASIEEIRMFRSALMHEFAVMDYEKGWAFQMHIGAMRNNNTRAFQNLGPDSGFDSIGDWRIARPLSRFLDRLDREGKLPRTILYNLNPGDNPVIATMLGNFVGDGIPGKMQHGPAWWFHDQKEGMEEHLQTLSNMGLLSKFVGMVTDSRSFLSFPRHEYYRRVLCNMLGSDMERGIIPQDYEFIGGLVEKLCYRNALEYFSYRELPEPTVL